MTRSDTSFPAVGCIGCGTMGGAILRGLSARPDLRLYGCDHDPAALEKLTGRGVIATASSEQLARSCPIILVAVKPAYVVDVLTELRPYLRPESVIISIAAGVALSVLDKALGHGQAIVRVMPNTPALVGAGQFALCLDHPRLSDSSKILVRNLFAGLGLVMELPEHSFSAFTAVAGCGPAYVFHMMDAVAEAAVTLGFSRPQAVELTTALFAGSAKLAQEAGAHLATLREQVCSPGGVTIAGTNQLERTAVRGHIIDAILVAADRDRELEHARTMSKK